VKSNSKLKDQKAKLRCALHIILKMFLVLSCSFAFLVLSFEIAAIALTGSEIIDKVDVNMNYLTGYFESEMIIHVRDEIRTKKMVSWAEGREKSFAEFTYPARDKGVKYLKIEDNMWMYLPSVDKIIKIAGHMLRQSMMGSDFSYEDALESTKLLEKYDVKLVTEETIPISFRKGTEEVSKQRPCYALELTAKVKEVTYYRRRIWVDKEIFLPVKEELFARSGKKLKVMILGNVVKFGKRHYPLYFAMRNLLRKDSLTEMIITKAEFDVKIPEDTFTQRNLRK
jgi:outer membrane lipoprotein-sorting protein